MSAEGTDSLDVTIVVVEGGGVQNPPQRPLPPTAQLWLEYERDRIANPTTPRPWRPYLTPPPHPPLTPPPDSDTPPPPQGS
jgi:hypothetical protein